MLRSTGSNCSSLKGVQNHLRVLIRAVRTNAVAFAVIGLVAGLAFALVPFIGFALSSPVYPDEFAYVRLNSRALWDGMTLSALFPFCQSAQQIPMPLSFYPGFAFEYLIYGSVSSSFMVRVLGGLVFCLFLALQAGMLFRYSREKLLTQMLLVIALTAFLFMGVSPLVYVMSRPEMAMNLCLGILLLQYLWLNGGDGKVSRFKLFSAVLIFIFTLSFFFLQHPKALIFTPFLLCITYFSFAGRSKKLAGLAIVYCLILAGQGFFLSRAKTACPEVPSATNVVGDAYLEIGLLAVDPVTFVSLFADNMAKTGNYARAILFQPTYQKNWLPDVQEFESRGVYVSLNTWIHGSLFLLLGLYVLAVLRPLYPLAVPIHPGKWWRESLRVNGGMAVILLMSAVTLLILSGLQTTKKFYEPSCFLPLMTLMSAFGFATIRRPLRHLQWLALAAAILVTVLAYLSLSLLQTSLGPKAFATYQGPSLTHESFDRIYQSNDLQRAAEHCGISTDQSSSHVVVEDLTYFFLQKTRFPILVSYLFHQMKLRSDNVTAHFFPRLRELNSDGFLLRCAVVPEHLRAMVKAYGEVCCLGKNQFPPPDQLIEPK